MARTSKRQRLSKTQRQQLKRRQARKARAARRQLQHLHQQLPKAAQKLFAIFRPALSLHTY